MPCHPVKLHAHSRICALQRGAVRPPILTQRNMLRLAWPGLQVAFLRRVEQAEWQERPVEQRGVAAPVLK